MSAFLHSLEPWLAASIAAGVVAFAAAFIAINVGLRLLPEGRAWLARARAERRWVVDPSRAAAPRIRLLFWGAIGLAIGAGFSVWPIFHAELLEPIWPMGRPVAMGPGGLPC